MNKPRRLLSAMSRMVTCLLIVLFAAGCDGAAPVVQPPPPAPPTQAPTQPPAQPPVTNTTCSCPVTSDYTSATSDPNEGSYVTVPKNTKMTPNCQCITAEYISWKDLNSGTTWSPQCLKCDPEKYQAGACALSAVEYISAIDVQPNDQIFDLPTSGGAASYPKLSYQLPTSFAPGTNLTILQYDKSVGCVYNLTNPWKVVSVMNEPAKVNDKGDFADGPFVHTSVYLLVRVLGDFSAYGDLVTPRFAASGDAITITMQVNGSQSNPGLDGQLVDFSLTGIKDADPAQLANYLGDESTILLQHFPDGWTRIWSTSGRSRDFIADKISWK